MMEETINLASYQLSPSVNWLEDDTVYNRHVILSTYRNFEVEKEFLRLDNQYSKDRGVWTIGFILAAVILSLIATKLDNTSTILLALLAVLSGLLLMVEIGLKYHARRFGERYSLKRRQLQAIHHEVTSFIMFLALSAVVGVQTYNYRNYCNGATFMAKDRPKDQRDEICSNHVYFYTNILFLLPIVMEKPRFFQGYIALLVMLIAAIGSRFADPYDTGAEAAKKFVIILAFSSINMSLWWHLESRRRYYFRTFTSLTADIMELVSQESSLSEFVEAIIPPLLRTRLLEGHTIVDRSANATCVVISVFDFVRYCSTMLPSQAAVVMSGLSVLCSSEALACNMDKIRSIGDTTVAVCNLLVKEKHHATTAANYALRVMRSVQYNDSFRRYQLSLSIAMHTGHIVGAVVGTNYLRYDVFGVAVDVARTAVPLSEDDQVLCTEDTMNLLNTNYVMIGALGQIVTCAQTGTEHELFVILSAQEPEGQSSRYSSSNDTSKYPKTMIHTVFPQITTSAPTSGTQAQEEYGTVLTASKTHVLTEKCKIMRRFENDLVENDYWNHIWDTHRRGCVTLMCEVSAGAFMLAMMVAIGQHDEVSQGSVSTSLALLLLATIVGVAFSVVAIMCPPLFMQSGSSAVLTFRLLQLVQTVLLMIGATLSAPSTLGNDIFFILGTTVAIQVFSGFTAPLAAGILACEFFVALMCTVLYKGILLGEMIIIVAGVLLLVLNLVNQTDRRLRRGFFHLTNSEQVHGAIHHQRRVRQGILRALIPGSLQVKVVQHYGTGSIETWSCADVVVAEFKMFALANQLFVQARVDKSGKKVVDKVASTYSTLENIVAKHANVDLVELFGDTVLVVGPLQKEEEEVFRQSAEEVVGIMRELITSGVDFTAAAVLEQAVHCLTHSNFPTFQVFGYGVAVAHGILEAAPMGSKVITDKFQGLVGEQPCEFVCGPEEPWRLRGLGLIRCHTLRESSTPSPVVTTPR